MQSLGASYILYRDDKTSIRFLIVIILLAQANGKKMCSFFLFNYQSDFFLLLPVDLLPQPILTLSILAKRNKVSA